MSYKIIDLINREDERGRLFEVFKESEVGRSFKGQVFIATTKPGKTRGLHFHKRKTEWYSVLRGKAKLTIINNETKEEKFYNMNGKNPQVVEIPPKHFHFIKNIGKSDMQLLVYVDEVFNSENPDTFTEDPRTYEK